MDGGRKGIEGRERRMEGGRDREEGGREGGRERRRRKRRREGEKEGEKEGEIDGEKEGQKGGRREGDREGGREGGRNRGRERRREGILGNTEHYNDCVIVVFHIKLSDQIEKSNTMHGIACPSTIIFPYFRKTDTKYKALHNL